MRSSTLATLALLALFATGCRGKVLATAELRGSGSAKAHLGATRGKLSLWADTDGKWRDAKELPVKYEIDVSADGKSVGHVSCDTRHVSETICGMTVKNGSERSGDCEMKMRCALPALPATGDVTLDVTATLEPDVESVTKVSLNVRAD